MFIKDKNLNCRVYKTTRGRHFLFKNKGITKCYTHTHIACGLIADIKVGLTNSYEILKFDGKERDIEWDKKVYQELPSFLIPVRTNKNFLNMKEGDGRNTNLFGYELVLLGVLIIFL